MVKYLKKPLALLLLLGACLPVSVYAQVPPPVQAPQAQAASPVPEASLPANTALQPSQAAPAQAPAAAVNQEPLSAEELNIKFTGSLFLTPGEIALIQQAMSGKLAKTDAPKEEQAMVAPNRLIEVSGVLYHGPQNWIVWMNGQKMTPKKLLPEVIEIEVTNSSYVKFKWYDAARKMIIPVTMRPRQTYDIATGLIWPGAN